MGGGGGGAFRLFIPAHTDCDSHPACATVVFAACLNRQNRSSNSPIRLLDLRRLVLLDVGAVALLLDVLIALLVQLGESSLGLRPSSPGPFGLRLAGGTGCGFAMAFSFNAVLRQAQQSSGASPEFGDCRKFQAESSAFAFTAASVRLNITAARAVEPPRFINRSPDDPGRRGPLPDRLTIGMEADLGTQR